MPRKSFRSIGEVPAPVRVSGVVLPVVNCHVVDAANGAILQDNSNHGYGATAMGGTLWFIDLLKDQPWIGFLIGLVFVAVMFGSKNLVIYFYSRHKEKSSDRPT
ncbi:MAG: hypothetical protein OQL28_00900 [Sedimenticola sp.]|nr:hypothetical protein [Sedimenticola sp.]